VRALCSVLCTGLTQVSSSYLFGFGIWISRHPGFYKLIFILLFPWNRDPFCPEACEGAEVAAVARWGKSWLLFTVHGYTTIPYMFYWDLS
jgi:hypothetical protein